jgi:hypothetical protein
MTNGEQMTADQDSTFEPSTFDGGAPAALESFRVAERVLTEMGVE